MQCFLVELRYKFKTLRISTFARFTVTKVGRVVTLRGSHLPSQISLWSSGHLMSHHKIKICFQFHKTRKHQTWHSGNLGWGTPSSKNIWSLITWSDDVTRQVTNVSSPLPQKLWKETWPGGELGWGGPTYQVTRAIGHVVTLPLAQLWLRVINSHPQSSVTLDCVVTCVIWQIRNGDGLSCIKPYELFLKWYFKVTW